MTLEEWRDSPYGIPLSPKRDCGIYCKCLLYPVMTPDIEAGADISSPEAQELGGAA